MATPTGVTILPDGQMKVSYSDGSALFALPVLPLAGDGNFQFGSTAAGSSPGALLHHRAAVNAADGTAKPDPATPATGTWLANPGGKTRARVFVSSTGNPTATLRPYLRSGGATGHVAGAALQSLNGAPNYDGLFDVQADGDDLLVYVETLSTGTVDVYVSWR